MNNRASTWARLNTDSWDLIVVGGGITGAGILNQANRLGLHALLIEQRDFAWGTSSRSSKMVHGGLRYLKDGNLHLTYESVRERQALLEAAPGLVEELGFLIANYEGDKPGKTAYGAGLTVYDAMALTRSHRYYKGDDFRLLAPHLRDEGLIGGYRYGDAQTDDARLVLRVLFEAQADGAVALNYAQAEGIIREGEQVIGVTVRDPISGAVTEARAKVVISATGAWADGLRGQTGVAPKIRPLRGSHLVFPAWRLPVAQTVNFLHPLDRRPVFAFPWEGATLVGTTDVDHHGDLNTEPSISPEEVAYLMSALEVNFPGLKLTLDDVIGAWAGVRPVIGTGKADPSKESRDHAIWDDHGLITVTGGKLTTFRVMALDALEAARPYLPTMSHPDRTRLPLQELDLKLDQPPDEAQRRRLMGRYGAAASALIRGAQPGELELIPGTFTFWAELRHAARCEQVVHLEDLMLRRTRLGMVLPDGGESLLGRVRTMCQESLGWDDPTWEQEQAAYLTLWRKHYSLPDRALIPDWRVMLAQKQAAAQSESDSDSSQPRVLWLALIVFPIMLILILIMIGKRRGRWAD
ncbi:glycerol-3-phosphate dehydrogenase [Anaerolineae bacterium]|nr:glycerol-3-phosphate dehydrogenase [Anaerolineae bacterium]